MEKYHVQDVDPPTDGSFSMAMFGYVQLPEGIWIHPIPCANHGFCEAHSLGTWEIEHPGQKLPGQKPQN